MKKKIVFILLAVICIAHGAPDAKDDDDDDGPPPKTDAPKADTPSSKDKDKASTASSASTSTSTTTATTTTTTTTQAPLNPAFKKLDWLVGKWRGEFSGKVFWPTIPTMNYGEELIVEEAPVAKSSGVKFLNFSARAWSHTTKDQLHDEWGFMTVNDNGNVTLMTTGNNGFTTYEEGWVEGQQLVLRLKKIGRISFSRDLPVEDIERRFKRLDKTYLEQALRMRTATHPKNGLLDHTIIIYEKKA